MTELQKNTTLEGPAALAATLLETLHQEQEALAVMGEHLAHQLAAVRTNEIEALEQATFEVNESAATLDRLRQTRTGQLRLLGRVLRLEATPSLEDTAAALAHHYNSLAHHDHSGDGLGQRLLAARAQFHEQANETRALFLELQFLLSYAIKLGRVKAQAFQEIDMAPPAHIYTANGTTARPTHTRTFVNKVG